MNTNNIPPLKLSGLEPLVIFPESNFINVGERTNVMDSRNAYSEYGEKSCTKKVTRVC